MQRSAINKTHIAQKVPRRRRPLSGLLWFSSVQRMILSGPLSGAQTRVVHPTSEKLRAGFGRFHDVQIYARVLSIFRFSLRHRSQPLFFSILCTMAA